MSSSNRIVLIVLPIVALIGVFWFLILAPKRERATELESQASQLESQVSEQEQLAASAETARKDFPRAYRRLVVLGKATPQDDDTASLLLQLNRIADNSGVDFLALKTAEESGDSSAAPPPPAPSAAPGESAPAPVDSEPAAPVSQPATEASAALLPIGASIGPAGLPVMKYTLEFEGNFFRLADFIAGIDDLVATGAKGHIGVRGRLITIDSFDLVPLDESIGANPVLNAEFTVTTFLTPAEEGATGGASPTGPAPVTGPQPASATPSVPENATASTTP
jgi:hypothetical protein